MTKTLPVVKNEMIRASAGSGKTYRLTNRFIRLMALGVEPEHLIALTFTRKAAGEFFDEILNKLAAAARDPAHAAALAGSEDFEMPDFDSGQARVLLRKLVERMHLLSLGTLDSFFNRILRSFPAEFGLSKQFEILQEFEKAAARQEVFAGLFREIDNREEFIEEFRLATFGGEERSLKKKLDDFVQQYHLLYLRAPDEELWGDQEKIWDGGCPYLDAVEIDIEKECEALEPFLEYSGTLHKSAVKSWKAFFDLVRRYYPGYVRGGQCKTLVQNLLTVYPEMRAGETVIVKNHKDHEIMPDAGRHLARLLDWFMYCELKPHFEKTRGLYRVMRRFENSYHARVRRAGRLGFDDVQRILAGSGPEPGPALSQFEREERHLRIDYRLDGRYGHWLLDEFQDTSPLQWRVIENLVDEVVQDASGQRSFFCVGDIKQAIFAWRGGDSRLFEQVHRRYNNEGAGPLHEEHMEESWRSSPVILDVVNRVFGDRELLAGFFPGHKTFVQRWSESFDEHTTHYGDRVGWVQLINAVKPEGEKSTPGECRYEIVRALLDDLRPHERGLSCAVLVRTNPDGAQVTDYLRRKSRVPVVFESDTEIGNDHPLGATFISLLHFSAHPADTFAWKHVSMTPPFARLGAHALPRAREELAVETLSTVYDLGFAAVLERWVRRLEEAGVTLDSYGANRLQSLTRAAREFDFTGNRRVEDFLAYLRAFTSREVPAAGVVQVMTIHKAKGLTFDLVLVADIEGNDITSIGSMGLTAHVNEEREAEWVLSFPRKDVCDADPVLREARRKIENEDAFEELCTLYVALTRAKFANYIITSPENGKANLRSIVAAALADGEAVERKFGAQAACVLHESGNADWFEDEEVHAAGKAASEKREEQAADLQTPVTATRQFAPLRRRFPSRLLKRHDFTDSGRWFHRRGGRAAAYGTLVHSLLEQIEWLEETGEKELRELWTRTVDLDADEAGAAQDEALQALAAPAIRAFFTQTGAAAESGRLVTAWREKRFEIVRDDEWISGTFDRVLVTWGASDHGRHPVSAEIVDFKTNRVESEDEITESAAHYGDQMSLYREALARVLGIGEDAIRCHLVFTWPCRVVEI